MPPAGPSWAKTHAALPSVDLTEDTGGYLYFSSRDGEGRAHIGRAPLAINADRLEVGATEEKPVLGLGSLGAFDDRGVTNSCLVTHGTLKYLYYSGWSLGRTVPFYFYVGLAVSENGGETFERVSRAPVLERDEVDPYLTASPWVLVEGDLWRMWYVSGAGWTSDGEEPRHRYNIKHATSRDGIHWSRDGTACIDFAHSGEYAISRPCVLSDGDRYRMWFAARGESYRIGYAESADGRSWDRLDAEAGIDVSESGWDSEMIEYPVVFETGDTAHLLYNGNAYGGSGIGYAQRPR